MIRANKRIRTEPGIVTLRIILAYHSAGAKILRSNIPTKVSLAGQAVSDVFNVIRFLIPF